MHEEDVPSAAGRSITTAPPARVVARCVSVRALVDNLTSIAVFFASMDALRTASITCRVTVIAHRASQRLGGRSPPCCHTARRHQPPSSRHAPMAMATPQKKAVHVRISVSRVLRWARGVAGSPRSVAARGGALSPP
jgi:hypothetical protein